MRMQIKKTPDMIRLMETFSDFNDDIIRRLLADCIHKWTDDEFASLLSMIDFRTAGKRNPNLLDDLENEILIHMNSQTDDKIFQRLKKIYNRIKSS